MMNVGTGLETVNMGDAFVNAWDVANKVSDLLMVKMDRELCDCAGDMNKYMTTDGNGESKDGNGESKDGSGSSGSVFFCRFMDTSKGSNTNIYSNANDNNSETGNSNSENKLKKS